MFIGNVIMNICHFSMASMEKVFPIRGKSQSRDGILDLTPLKKKKKAK